MNDQNTKIKENIEYVKGKLQPAEILAQLAEEAAELGQAALKLRRAILGTNPTPISEEEAKYQLLVEYGDVRNCLKVWSDFELDETDAIADELVAEKFTRWAGRLKAAGRKPITEAAADIAINGYAEYLVFYNGESEKQIIAFNVEDLEKHWADLCKEMGCDPDCVDSVIRIG